MHLMDVMLAFPGILLASAIVAIPGPGLNNAMFAVGIEAIPTYVRTVRASTLAAREHDYVLSAQAARATASRIMFRHILTSAGLSFIGLGAQRPTPTGNDAGHDAEFPARLALAGDLPRGDDHGRGPRAESAGGRPARGARPAQALVTSAAPQSRHIR